MEASVQRYSMWLWFWMYFVLNTFDTKLFSHVIIRIDHGWSGVMATTPLWFVVRRGRPWRWNMQHKAKESWERCEPLLCLFFPLHFCSKQIKGWLWNCFHSSLPLFLLPSVLQLVDAVILQMARFMGPTWGPSGADRTQVGPMLTPWTLLSGSATTGLINSNSILHVNWNHLGPHICNVMVTCLSGPSGLAHGPNDRPPHFVKLIITCQIHDVINRHVNIYICDRQYKMHIDHPALSLMHCAPATLVLSSWVQLMSWCLTLRSHFLN